MSKEIKISNECATNVADIQLSESTKALLLCRAQLSDIYNTIGDIVYSRYKEDLSEDIQDAHIKLDGELVKIISMFIEVTSLLSNYKEM